MKLIPYLLVALLCACASSGKRINHAAVDKIEVGKTTQTEVAKLMGAPEIMLTSTTGESTWTYKRTEAHIMSGSLVPVFGVFSGTKLQSAIVLLTFSTNGIVREISTGGETSVGHNFDFGPNENPVRPKAGNTRK